MGIFSRLSDIINSNINSILDRAEDPEKIIRLMIQEMEDTLIEVRSQAARAIADRKDVTRRLDRLDGAQLEWTGKAELALSKGREDLAKAALMEKSKLSETAGLLGAELELLDNGLARQEEDIQRLETKLREAKTKQKSILARHETASSSLRTRRQVHDRRIDDAFQRFEQMEQRVDSVESQVEAYDLGRGKTLAEEIAELEAESSVEEELAALKRRVGSRTATTGAVPVKE